MKFERKPMVNWYDPKQLAFTSVKTVLSSVFGNFADRRELQAALDQETNPFDYSQKEELWFDYISDLGDGFNPTFTLAHLLGRESLALRGKILKRGDILVMGGDEVYPTPENIEYDNRLRGPYTAAFPKDKSDIDRPDVFAIPGNHDWYDGLTNFLRLFTQKRSLGNWKTQQNRSYFALKLPYDYWIIAIDIQLNADIDFPQICYFKEMARAHFNSNSKLILCTSEPSWVYKSFDLENGSFDRLQFFIDKVLLGRGDKAYEEKNKNINIEVILTGDLHHYARKAKLEKTFPPKSSSVKLSLLNLAFPFFSRTMLLFFGIYNVFTSYILQTKMINGTTLMENLSGYNLFNNEFPEIFYSITDSTFPLRFFSIFCYLWVL